MPKAIVQFDSEAWLQVAAADVAAAVDLVAQQDGPAEV